MALFRREGFLGRETRVRRTHQAQSSAIAEFWAWWTRQGARATGAALASGHPEYLEQEISRLVDAIAPDLAWQIAPGQRSRHLLLLSSEGDPKLRAVVRRWLLAAPPPDGVWEYSDTRRPAADPAGVVLRLDDADLDAARAGAHARVHGAALDVTVYHPEFIGLPEQSQALATFLLLDSVLGQSAMELWLGSVGVTDVPPLDPVPLAGLRSVIAELRSRFTTADGSPAWVTLEGTAPDGSPVVAAAQVPLRSATAPHLDTYLGMAVPFLDVGPDGLPTDTAAKRLADLEEELTEATAGRARVVAHETASGVRVLHLYVDSTTGAADVVRTVALGWEQGLVNLDQQLDPGWESVRHLVV